MTTEHFPIIRKYTPNDEVGWIRCRVLSFLDSAYYDNVYQKKEQYDGIAIELVAEIDEQITGLIDIECESKPSSICSRDSEYQPHLAGMLWHIAIHPDFRRLGVAKALLHEAKKHALEFGISRLEAWTRDDDAAEQWYLSQGFKEMQYYYHIYIEPDEMKIGGVSLDSVSTIPQSLFVHYTGNDQSFLQQFKRVYKCQRFDLII